MSSNAFARSRPRVRHQRVPRTHSCDHPRFLQLVNELARINEAKKKQEELEGDCTSVGSGRITTSEASNDEDGNISSCAGGGGGGGTVGAIISSGLSSGATCSISSNLSGSSCCNVSPVCEAQTSNGYRSLDNNQQSSTSALHDNYHHQHQQQLHNNQQHYNNHHHHHHHHHNHHHSIHHHQDSHQQHLGNNLQQQHLNDCCPSKSSSASNFGYSKQNLVVEHNNPSDFSTSNSNHSDLNRQDENRSKRRKLTNDSSNNSRQKNSSSCSGGTSKRLKGSPDAIRPLSPSFTKCPICLLDSMDRDPSFTNTCFHLFCYVCIENWTKNKATCPLCRTKFTKIIYNIKSATNYEEKIASPIRRDEDDQYISDRLMLEQLSGLNSNSSVSNRNTNSDDVQFLFENIRNTEALLPQFYVNQMDPRLGESNHTFNTVTGSANFNSNVPHPPFNPHSYPIASSYLIFQPNRIATSTTSTAISGAYTANTSLTNINNDPNSSRRISRSGRSFYPRNYETQSVDAPSRVSRASNTSSNINQPGVSIERNHHHHHPHQHHQHASHRSTLDMSPRQNQRLEQSHIHLQLPYPIQQRHYNQSAYPRRPYNNPVSVEHQHILDTFYRQQLPDM